MLTGNNGILTQAQEAKTKTDKASIIEQVRTDILEKQAEKQSSDVFTNDLEEILKKYFSNDEANIKNIVEGTTGEGEETQLISKEDNNIKIDLSEIYSGEIKKVILAKDVLIPNIEEKTTPYVLYNNLLCRAFYNDDIHGLQIITNDNVKNDEGEEEKVILGEGDKTVEETSELPEGMVSYNNAVDTLNNKAKEYMGTKAIDARSVGNKATLKEGLFDKTDDQGLYAGDNNVSGEYYKLKNADTNYEEDVARINELGINSTNTTWLASREVRPYSEHTDFGIHRLGTSGNVTYGELFSFSGKNISIGNMVHSFRPVFLLPDDITISGGSGTSEDPYVIE